MCVCVCTYTCVCVCVCVCVCMFVMGFPCGSAGKESSCKAEDLGSIPGLGRPPGEGKGYPLQYSGLENSMDCIVHGVPFMSGPTDMTEQLSIFSDIYVIQCF